MSQHNRIQHPDDHRRMIIFFVLAAVIMTLSYFFITKPNMERARQQAATTEQAAPTAAQAYLDQNILAIDKALAATPRIPLDNPLIEGSLPATGVRFDDVVFKNYFVTLDKTEQVRLLAPSNSKPSYFVEIGLLAADAAVAVPDNNTIWTKREGDVLAPGKPVVLQWDNGAGQVYTRTVTLDEQYMITVVQKVTNKTGSKITYYPYALLSQTHHTPQKGEKTGFEEQESGVQHIGPIAYLGDELIEENYDDLKETESFQYEDVKGWMGITSKYWLVTLLPDNNQTFDARFSHRQVNEKQDVFQADVRLQPITIDANGSSETRMRFFAGAKDLDILTAYAENQKIDRFDLSMDFGVLYILTKPLYHLLNMLGKFFHDQLGWPISFGLALLSLTVIVRIALFPLQNKSYSAMNKMKDLGPKLHDLKEKYGDDKQKFQQEVMAMYKREKVNPASGCLPILLQIPIFFALYKVIYITLDMRHAPFWGWVHDLSAPDPTNVWNLFGLLDFNTPSFMVIGAWPLLYGFTMWLQQRLNPQPEDELQKQIFAMMPWMFMFIFAKFPAGLVIYYTWSNVLGIIQQYSLRRLNPGMIPAKEPKKAKK